MMATASAIVISLCLLPVLLPPPLASATLNLWPMPTLLSWPDPISSLLSRDFKIIFPNHRHLAIAARRYNTLILTSTYNPIVPPNTTSSSSKLKNLNISVTDISALLQHGANESYILIIPPDGGSADLKAATPWGAMRGLETFLQLTWGNPMRVAAAVRIQDSPIFPHRGLMVDTSRNFYPVRDLLRTIGAMSMNKMNVFHWHITDSQSFPIVLPSEPDLAGKGSYGPQMEYTAEDVTRIVEFGREHGVRVLPEFDTPAHTGSWGKAYPDIVTCANMFWWPAGVPWSKRFASEPGAGQLNPLVETTYNVVRNVIRDAVALFPEGFFHAGCDEVVSHCWTEDKRIRTFLNNSGTLGGLLEMFVNSTLPFIASLNRTAVYWEDILLDEEISVPTSFLPKENVILQTWKSGPNSTKEIVALGYRVIVSSSDFYYLDCGHGGFVGNDSMSEHVFKGDGGSWCGAFKTWQLIYNHDITEGLTSKEAGLVLGAEVALWSEQSDNRVMDGRIWPRGCALAESLWSGNRDEKTGKLRYGEVTNRLNEWRYRMVGRGVNPEPLQPLWCVLNPGMCNTVNPSSS